MRRENLIKVIEAYPEEYGGRYFDYKAKKTKAGYYKIYRRCYDGEPWLLYCRCIMIDDILFTNWSGLTTTLQQEYDRCGYFEEHPKDKERFICGATAAAMQRRNKKEE